MTSSLSMHPLLSLVERLLDPSAYPYWPEHVELEQIHVSSVFLMGPYAYKGGEAIPPRPNMAAHRRAQVGRHDEQKR